MKIQSSRGQAALEFLTTYGWAFLVILIMISALGYFGVLDPQNFLPERCNMASEFQCDDYLLNRTDGTTVNANLFFVNQAGTTVTVNAFDIEQSAEVSSLSCLGSPVTVAASDGFEINCTGISPASAGNTFPADGDKLRMGFTMTYREAGGRYDHEVSGELFATLQ